MPKRKTVKKPKAPQDATLRNVRAAKKRLDSHTALLTDHSRWMASLAGRLDALEEEVRQLRQHAPSESEGPGETEID